MVASVIANANRDSKRHPEPYKVTDFVLDFGLGRPGSGNGDSAASRRKPITTQEEWKGVMSMAKKLAMASNPPRTHPKSIPPHLLGEAARKRRKVNWTTT